MAPSKILLLFQFYDLFYRKFFMHMTSTIPFFLLIARESVWTPFMVSVNTEDGWLYFGKRIFAIPISPVAVIVRSITRWVCLHV